MRITSNGAAARRICAITGSYPPVPAMVLACQYPSALRTKCGIASVALAASQRRASTRKRVHVSEARHRRSLSHGSRFAVAFWAGAPGGRGIAGKVLGSLASASSESRKPAQNALADLVQTRSTGKTGGPSPPSVRSWPPSATGLAATDPGIACERDSHSARAANAPARSSAKDRERGPGAGLGPCDGGDMGADASAG